MAEKFKKLFRFTRIALLLSGVKIERNFNKSFMLKYVFFVTQIWTYFCFFGQINYIIHCIKLGLMEDVMFDAPCVAFCLLSTTKITNFFYKNDVVIDIFENLVNIFPKDVTIEEDSIILDSVATFKKIVYALTGLCIAVLFAFNCLPVVLMGIAYYSNGSTDFKYPFDVYYNVSWDGLPFHLFIYFNQVVGAIIVTMNLCGPDTIFYGSCSFIAMHFNLLSYGINNLNINEYDPAIVHRKLGDLVKRHQLLLSLVSKMKQLYSRPSLFNFITSSLLICLIAFNITSYSELRAVVAFGSFLFMSLAQIFVLCYGGEVLTESSEEVSIAAYNCSWYAADQRTKRSIMIILMRSQKPCTLTAGGFTDLNIEAFGTVLSRSWSYFAMLKTMY